MKNLILVIAVLVAGACATTPTMKSVAGTYENATNAGTWKLLLMKDGKSEGYKEGSSDIVKGDWKIVDGELHTVDEKDRIMAIHRINKEGSITHIAWLIDGKREEIPKDKQPTSKKIK